MLANVGYLNLPQNMIRFPDRNKDEYKDVIWRLHNLAGIDTSVQSAGNMMAPTSPTELSETSQDAVDDLMTWFSSFDIADYQDELPKPVKGTCHWILEHSKFKSWMSQESPSILWLTGELIT